MSLKNIVEPHIGRVRNSENDWVVDVKHPFAGQEVVYDVDENFILFIVEGQVEVSFRELCSFKVEYNHMFFLPAGGKATVVAHSEATIIVFRCKTVYVGHERYTIEALYSECYVENTKFVPLEFNDRVDAYVRNLMVSIGDGLIDRQFLDAKIIELLFMLKKYYWSAQLAAFFALKVSTDILFYNFIWDNYRSVRNVNEFATISNMGLSSFKARFKKVFGIPVMHWLNEQKARNIYIELTTTSKPLKQISSEYHFASVSHLNTFCQNKLSATPGKIRQSAMLDI